MFIRLHVRVFRKNSKIFTNDDENFLRKQFCNILSGGSSSFRLYHHRISYLRDNTKCKMLHHSLRTYQLEAVTIRQQKWKKWRIIFLFKILWESTIFWGGTPVHETKDSKMLHCFVRYLRLHFFILSGHKHITVPICQKQMIVSFVSITSDSVIQMLRWYALS